MKNISKRFDIWLTILFFLLVIPAERSEIFSLLEDQTLSTRQLFRMSYGDPDLMKFPSDKIFLINTDEAFFEEYKSFPLRRTDIAKITDNLKLLGAKVIALDVLMDFPSSYDEDPTMAEALKKAGNTLLVSQADIENGKFKKLNYPTALLNKASASGYTNISSSSSLVTSLSRLRIYPEITKEKDGWPFAVRALAMYLGVEPRLENNMLHIGDEIAVELDAFNTFHIDFPALPPGTQFLGQSVGMTALEFLDISDLDEDELDELRLWVEDKIVILGDTSEVSHDWFDTPVGMVYGVEIIADTISTLMKNAPLRPASGSVEMIIALVMMALMLGISLIQKPLVRALLGIMVVVFYVMGSGVAYIHVGLILSMSYVIIASILSLLVMNLYYYLQERGQKNMIKGAFGQYLSPKVVDILVKDPTKLTLGGEERNMTAFFSDVAKFSTISESLTPSELVALLNDYLTAMCNIITEYDGTVDKFEGDAIIAFWGAPLDQKDHAKLGCYTSIDMAKYMVGLRERLARENGPHMTVRIGLNSGPMVVGNMGSAQRMDYTIMGDSVNLAARLEGANKFYDSGTMISQFTYEQAKDFIDVRKLDTVRVVGKKEPITIYQLLDRKNQLSGPLADVVEQYDRAMKFYLDMDFATARDEFRKGLDIMADDGPCKAYVARCETFLKDPPPQDWDRVFNFTSKG